MRAAIAATSGSEVAVGSCSSPVVATGPVYGGVAVDGPGSMARMTRRPALLAASLVLGAALLPFPIGPAARAATPSAAAHAAAPVTTAATTAIVPGVVNRSSLFLAATYDAYLKVSWGPRTIYVDSTATIRNTSGGPIDRVELNTIAARLGAIRMQGVTVDGKAVAAAISDQTIIVPLGGILPVDAVTTVRVRYGATVRSSLTGSNWMFTRTNGVLDLYRWLPWVSRRIAFDRPNHGDPFETPVSSVVKVKVTTSRKLILGTTGDRTSVSADGLTSTFIARNVRDFTVTAAEDYHTTSRKVGNVTVRVYYRPGGPGAAMLDAAADAFSAYQNKLGGYPHPTLKVVQSAGGYGMESPGLIWVPTGVASSNLRYLAAHETAHQWFYGIVGDDQALEPFTDEAMADFAARNILGLKRASRCSVGRLDLSIYQYSSACYYERIYIQGGNLLDSARLKIGNAAFWAAVRGWIAAHRNGIATTSSLLSALDAATPIDLGHTLFAPRFPRLY